MRAIITTNMSDPGGWGITDYIAAAVIKVAIDNDAYVLRDGENADAPILAVYERRHVVSIRLEQDEPNEDPATATQQAAVSWTVDELARLREAYEEARGCGEPPRVLTEQERAAADGERIARLQAVATEHEQRAAQDTQTAAEPEWWAKDWHPGRLGNLTTAVAAVEDYLTAHPYGEITHGTIREFLDDVKTEIAAAVERMPPMKPTRILPGYDNAGEIPEPAEPVNATTHAQCKSHTAPVHIPRRSA